MAQSIEIRINGAKSPEAAAEIKKQFPTVKKIEKLQKESGVTYWMKNEANELLGTMNIENDVLIIRK